MAVSSWRSARPVGAVVVAAVPASPTTRSSTRTPVRSTSTARVVAGHHAAVEQRHRRHRSPGTSTCRPPGRRCAPHRRCRRSRSARAPAAEVVADGRRGATPIPVGYIVPSMLIGVSRRRSGRRSAHPAAGGADPLVVRQDDFRSGRRSRRDDHDRAAASSPRAAVTGRNVVVAVASRARRAPAGTVKVKVERRVRAPPAAARPGRRAVHPAGTASQPRGQSTGAAVVADRDLDRPSSPPATTGATPAGAIAAPSTAVTCGSRRRRAARRAARGRLDPEAAPRRGPEQRR